MKDDFEYLCPDCEKPMIKQIGVGIYVITTGVGDTSEDRKQREHTKKVKDFDRAIKMRKRAFGSDAVGQPTNDKADPRHVVRRGRTLGGQQKEIDKKEFIQAAAKDPLMVKKAQDAIKKSKKSN